MIDKPTNYFEHHREELLNFIPEGSAPILDIGCGSGGFLSNFDNKIYRVGIEPDIAAAEIARQRAD
jgi:SAM-dependent methyltransferase